MSASATQGGHKNTEDKHYRIDIGVVKAQTEHVARAETHMPKCNQLYIHHCGHARSTGTVHTSAKARLTSAAIWQITEQ